MESKLTPAAKMQQQPIVGEKLKFSASEDGVMLKQIQASHAPDGRVINVRPLLRIVEDIFNRAAPSAIVAPVKLPILITLFFLLFYITFSYS